MNYENMINKIVNDNSLNYIGNLILNNHEIQVLEQQLNETSLEV